MFNPKAYRNCIESDIYLSRNVEKGKYSLYKCKNNMWDMATPIIVGGKHIGNVFLGQFFFEDEAPDYGVFIDQAKIYGFDEKAYLAALEQVPRWSRETVQSVMEFYTRLADMVSKLSYGNIRWARLLSEQKRVEEALRASEAKYRIVADNTYDWEYWLSPEGQFLYISPSCQRITGWSAIAFKTNPNLLSGRSFIRMIWLSLRLICSRTRQQTPCASWSFALSIVKAGRGGSPMFAMRCSTVRVVF